MDNNDLLFRKPPNRLEKLMEDHEVTLKEVSENTGIPITTLSGYKKISVLLKRKMRNYYQNILKYLSHISLVMKRTLRLINQTQQYR